MKDTLFVIQVSERYFICETIKYHHFTQNLKKLQVFKVNIVREGFKRIQKNIVEFSTLGQFWLQHIQFWP